MWSQVLLPRQIWIINYYVKHLSDNLCNKKNTTGVSREISIDVTTIVYCQASSNFPHCLLAGKVQTRNSLSYGSNESTGKETGKTHLCELHNCKSNKRIHVPSGWKHYARDRKTLRRTFVSRGKNGCFFDRREKKHFFRGKQMFFSEFF